MALPYQTVVLDPTTHVAKQRTTFILPPSDCLSNLRLGGLGVFIGADGLINTSSGMGACIDTMTLRINGTTVQELRNASKWIAFANAVGTADAGASVLETTSISQQRFIPYTKDKDAAAAAIDQSTAVCSFANVAGVDATRLQESYIQLAPLMPFLKAVGVLQCSQYKVEIEILYQANLQNLLPFSAAPGGCTLTAPYLILDQLRMNLDTAPPSIEYTNVLTDTVVIPAVADGAAQAVTLQSAGFVGRLVQDIIFCKTRAAYAVADGFSGVFDGSFAQSNELMRVWVDGQQMTAIATNAALLQSYAPSHRAPLILTRPLMEQYTYQADANTAQQLGARSYPTVLVQRVIELNLQIDYSRTGYEAGADYPPGIGAINLVMFARCTSTFA